MHHPYLLISICATIVAVSLFIRHRYRLRCIECEIMQVLKMPEFANHLNHPEAIRARIARERTKAGYKYDQTEERCRPPLSHVVRGINSLSRKGRIRIKDLNMGGEILPECSLA